MEKLIKVFEAIEKIARRIRYGELKLDITISRGKIVKIVINNEKQTILL